MRPPSRRTENASRSTGNRRAPALVVLISSFFINGCGTTREYNATQQLVMSDAVDRSIAAIDFRPLSGRKVYLDTSYLQHIKGEGFVNAEYATSSLRQQIVAAGCLIQDTSSDSDVIIEARIGTLGADDHRVTFGVPENNALSTAASVIPGAPQVGAVPEIAFARREAREAAAKVAAFAYDRKTRAPVWQSGVTPAVATARDTWVMGIGPFQGGSIRERTKLAGSGLRQRRKTEPTLPPQVFERPPVDYTAVMQFQQGWPAHGTNGLSSEMEGGTIEEESALVQESEQPSSDTQIAETLRPSDSSVTR